MKRESRERPRIADVAREAGVSKTAVSFAFNSPERLSPDTANRIREIADTLGYRPHPVARMLTQQHTRTLGILTPQALSVVFANPFFAAFSEGVAAAAEEAGYGLLFVSPVYGSLARAVARATVDGFVALGLSEDHPEVEHIRRANLPIVMVDSGVVPRAHVGRHRRRAGRVRRRGAPGLARAPQVPRDRRRAAHPRCARRVRGRRGATARRIPGRVRRSPGSSSSTTTSSSGPPAPKAASPASTRAWEDGHRPTAVLAMSDAMAIGALNAAARLGLRVPADLSVVGFDDIELARHVEPPLTTVHQPVRRKGEDACRLLLAAIERTAVARPDHHRLETRLIVRGSTGPAPGRKEVAGGE